MKKIFDAELGELTDLRFSYFTAYPSLLYSGYLLERNDEKIICTQDIYYNHEFPALYLPKKSENWRQASITFTTAADRAALVNHGVEIILERPVGAEFFYQTSDFLEPKGEFLRRIKQFTTTYTYQLSNTYDKQMIKGFYHRWKEQRPHQSPTFETSEEFFFFCLDNLDSLNIKQVYVEINGALVGLAWGVKHQNGGWVGLHLKVDYSIKGLSRFLHQERARLFEKSPTFTLGAGAHDEGIEQYKKELEPREIVDYSYILTG